MLGCRKSLVWQKDFDLTFRLPVTLFIFSTYGRWSNIKLKCPILYCPKEREGVRPESDGVLLSVFLKAFLKGVEGLKTS